MAAHNVLCLLLWFSRSHLNVLLFVSILERTLCARHVRGMCAACARRVGVRGVCAACARRVHCDNAQLVMSGETPTPTNRKNSLLCSRHKSRHNINRLMIRYNSRIKKQ